MKQFFSKFAFCNCKGVYKYVPLVREKSFKKCNLKLSKDPRGKTRLVQDTRLLLSPKIFRNLRQNAFFLDTVFPTCFKILTRKKINLLCNPNYLCSVRVQEQCKYAYRITGRWW